MKRNIIVSVVTLVLIFLLYMGIEDSENNSTAVKWNGKQETEKVRTEVHYIEIPGITGMVFKANETFQRVNIHNPETNDCQMVFTLIINNKEYWKSGKCNPGYGYYELELSEQLEAGIYNASLLYECFRNGNALNSAIMNVTITVQ